MDIQFREYPPSENLRPFVELYWEGDFNRNKKNMLVQQVIPSGYAELVMHMSERHCHLIRPEGWQSSPDYTIIGLQTRPYEVRFTDRVQVFGIRFKPEGIYNLFGIPASLFTEVYEDMHLVLGRDFRNYSERLPDAAGSAEKIRLTEQFLLKSLAKHGRNFSYVNRAAEAIRKMKGEIRMVELPEYAFISQRQLQREFKDKIGLSPKKYHRLSRLGEVHRLLAAGGKPDLTEVSYRCGYSDQAHFIRDFHQFTGAQPSRFLRDRDRYIVNPNLEMLSFL
jgi:AraC-like DNA-binding protein